ncbi:unnamed protein product [Calypogeia fissa]
MVLPVQAKSSKDIRSLLHFYHKNKEGVFKSLREFDLSEKIIEAISRGERSISTQLLSQRDLKTLKQLGDHGTESVEVVDLVVEFPWDAGSFLTIVGKANDTQLRRQVLVMAVDRIRKTASLERILALKELSTCTIRENPYLGPGHPPYENFIDSLLNVTDTTTPAGDKLFEMFLKSAADDADETELTGVEKLGLRTVFHGTNHAVMDAILNSGLDPKCRHRYLNADYFGVRYPTSLAYTIRKTQVHSPTRCRLLVFLVIVDPYEDDEKQPDPHLKVKSNKLQLPLAEITLHHMTDLC